MSPNAARRHFAMLPADQQLATVKRLAAEHGVSRASHASGLSVEQIRRLVTDEHSREVETQEKPQ